MIWISGKISNLPGEMVRSNFDRVIRELIKIGFKRNEIVSPLDLLIPYDTPSCEAVKLCYPHFKKCDAVFFMENYRESTGCFRELDLSLRMDLKRFFEDWNGFERIRMDRSLS